MPDTAVSSIPTVRAAKRIKLNHYGLPVSVMHWQGEGPTVFCLHGWLDQGAHFEWIAQTARRYCNLYALDFRGHGHSGRLKGSTYAFMDYLLDVDTLYKCLGVERAVLLGHSMGGMVASYYAAAVPEKVAGVISLEGIGPPSHTFKGLPKVVKSWLDGYDKRLRPGNFPPITVEQAADRLQKNLPKLPRDRALFLARHGVKKTPGGYEWRFDRRLKEVTPYRFHMELALGMWSGLKGPLVYVQGADSSFMGLNDLQERIDALKAEETVTLPGVGHHIPLEAPEEVAGILKTCLERWGLLA